MCARPSRSFHDVGGKVLIDEGLIGEVDDEGFVLRVGGFDQIQSGDIHCCALVAHGAGVVDEHAHRNGDVLVLEGSDGLLHAIFKDVEVILLQVVDDAAIVVKNAGIEYDLIDVAAKGEAALFVLQGCTGLDCVRIRGADGLIVGGVRRDDGIAINSERGLLFRLRWRLLRRGRLGLD